MAALSNLFGDSAFQRETPAAEADISKMLVIAELIDVPLNVTWIYLPLSLQFSQRGDASLGLVCFVPWCLRQCRTAEKNESGASVVVKGWVILLPPSMQL